MSDPVNQITKAEEVSPGVVSMMRKGVQVAYRTGVFMVVCGALISGAMLIPGCRDMGTIAIAFITGGPALITLSLGAKAWQAQAEKGA